jgi:glycosyltransferase involved in cell wall biosynthesis
MALEERKTQGAPAREDQGMRILVVAPQPFFSPRGTPFSVYYRVLVAHELGYESDVLTYGQGTDVDIPGCRLVRIPSFSWLGKVKTGPSMLKLFLDVFMIVWTIALLIRHRYPIVHAHEEAVFWCRWLKPIFRFRLIYDMHSSLPQQLHNFRYTRSRVIHTIFERLERSAVRAADGVITICPALLEYAKTLTSEHDKLFLIENSIFDPVLLKTGPAGRPSGSALSPPELESWLSRRPKEQILVYAGTLETYQGIDRLLAAFALVLPRLPEAGLLMVGGQPAQVQQYRDQAKNLGIEENVLFTGQVAQAEAQRLVSIGSATVSPRATGDNTPLKIYQLMASGVPLLATRIESHTQVWNDDVATLTDVDPAALADGIVQVLAAPQKAREKAERAQAWYRTHYARDVYTGKMRALMNRVTRTA